MLFTHFAFKKINTNTNTNATVLQLNKNCVCFTEFPSLIKSFYDIFSSQHVRQYVFVHHHVEKLHSFLQRRTFSFSNHTIFIACRSRVSIVNQWGVTPQNFLIYFLNNFSKFWNKAASNIRSERMFDFGK